MKDDDDDNWISDVYAITPECSINTTVNECLFSLHASPSGCLSLDTLAQEVIDLGVPVLDQIPDVLSPSWLIIQSVDVNICNEMISVSTAMDPSKDLEIIPNVLAFEGVVVNIDVYLPTKYVCYGIFGEWGIHAMSFVTNMTGCNGKVDINGYSRDNADDFLGKFIGDVSDSTGQASDGNDLLSDWKISDVNVRLEFSEIGWGSEISGQVTVPHVGDCIVGLVTEKPINGPLGLSITLVTPLISISDVIKGFTSIDISSVPLIGDLQAPKSTMLWSAAIRPFSIVRPIMEEIKGLAYTLPGFSLELNTQLIDKSIKFLINKGRHAFSFNVLSGDKITAGDILEAIMTTLGTIEGPLGLDIVEFLDNIPLDNIMYDHAKSRIEVDIIHKDTLVVIPKILEFEETQAEFAYIFGEENCASSCLGIEFDTIWRIGGFNILLHIDKPIESQVFVASASPQIELDIGSLVLQFGAALLPSGPLEDALKGADLEGFKIINPRITMRFADTFVTKVSGMAVIGDWVQSEVEVIIGKVKSGPMIMATGIKLAKIRFSDIVKKLTNNKIDITVIPGISILDGSEIAIVFSSEEIPKSMDYMDFTMPMLSEIPIFDGISLVGLLRIPTPAACKSDLLCKLLARVLSGQELVLGGRLSFGEIDFRAHLPLDIEIFSGLHLMDVGLMLEVGATRNAIGLSGSLLLDSPPLAFYGEVGISTSGLYIMMSSVGFWHEPFGIRFLGIGNVHFRIAIVPDPVVLSALELGGTLRFGRQHLDPSDLIQVEVFVGIDRIVPINNYFYGSINHLTLNTILKAFGKPGVNLKPFGDMGFPEGANASCSVKTRMLPNGVTIPRGFYLRGRLKLLFLDLMAEINVNLNGLKINMTAGALSFAKGLIRVEGIGGRRGPMVYTALGWNPPVAEMIIEGSVTVLAIKVTVNITINERGASFIVEGSFLKLFHARVELRASYGSLSTADFEVNAYFRQDLISTLREMALSALKKIGDAADKAIKKAQDKINSANKDLDKVKDKLTNVQDDLDDKRQIFRNAADKLR